MKLTDSLQYVKGVGPKKQAELQRLGLQSVYDLLTYFPRTYEDQSVLTPIAELQAGEKATVSGTIMNLMDRQGGRRGMTILTALIGDGTGMLQVTWFNQKYLKDKLKVGRRVFVTGKAAYAYGGRGQFAMSQLSGFQILDDTEEPEQLAGIMPVYHATEKMNQKFFRRLLANLLGGDLEIAELLPRGVVKRYGLLSRTSAFHSIHFPADF
ncbi:MAG: DNA helicase RecG, partial [Selenomonas sp.]|nr:DNA helicase RecG [Selenomonas sp.]